MLGVRLDPYLQARLALVARTQGRSKSGIVREAVRRYVELQDEAFLAETKRQSLRAAARRRTAAHQGWEEYAATRDTLSDPDPISRGSA